MQRVTTLLDKIRELNQKTEPSLIEIDLMLDYTKVLYADLLEWRNKTAFTQSHTLPQQADRPEPNAPTWQSPAEPETAVAGPTPQPASATKEEPPAPETEQPAPATRTFAAAPGRERNIRSLIGINDKYQFISELFGNNREAYDEVLNQLNGFSSEEDALEWVHSEVYPRYGWSDENETLSTFYRVLSVFFSDR